jgi:hypothetical protein
MDEKYIYFIIRKPQEGKTFICIKNIKQNEHCLHIILTMNTIKSNGQFSGRLIKEFNNNVCILNSKKTQNVNHGKTATEIFNIIRKDKINNVIMCSNPKRYENSLPELLDLLKDSNSFKKSVIIHIDEAHAYVPSFRKEIVELNKLDIVERIYLYSATPFKAWVKTNVKSDYDLFKHLFIVNVEEQYNIKHSNKYFGVNNCELLILNNKHKLINSIIPSRLIKYVPDMCKDNLYYQENYIFSIGNEVKFLSWIQYILDYMYNEKYIRNDSFSYNFIPGYTRKITHYAIMEQILNKYDNGIVIIINGEGSVMYKNDNNVISKHILKDESEPNIQIENVITQYPNKPIFITGFHCVGMSVTFINEKIGNFDNVLFCHEHFISQPDVLYQLCRFLFNYISWSNCSKIKKTRLIVNNKLVYNSCLDYEKQIDKISKHYAGSLRSVNEVKGNIKTKMKRLPIEKKFEPLKKYVITSNIKTFTVDDDISEGVEKLEKVKTYCNEFLGRTLSKKSIPVKINLCGNMVYVCSITSNVTMQLNVSEKKEKIKKMSWYSNFQLAKNILKYCRIYVVYDDSTDPNCYTFIIKMLELEDSDECKKKLAELTSK